MTNGQKQLLLKDLCGRLPYDTIIKNKYSHIRYNFNSLVKDEDGEYLIDGVARLDEIEIYLRPMSSMTEEEEDEYQECGNKDIAEAYIHLVPNNRMDWLNAHHFDYRGLIEKGLALEAPEGMYI